MFSRLAVLAVALVSFGLVGIASVHAMVPTFSQSNITVGLGQTVTITTQNGVSLYLLSNSSPVTANVSVSGTQITATGQSLGTANLSVCATGTASDCTTVYITVQSATVSGITLSQNSLTLSVSGAQTVTISGGSGTYNVSSNSKHERCLDKRFREFDYNHWSRGGYGDDQRL